MKCKGCGYEITYVERFEGLPCNYYCCSCCPGKNDKGGCPKEKKLGNPIDKWI